MFDIFISSLLESYFAGLTVLLQLPEWVEQKKQLPTLMAGNPLESDELHSVSLNRG